MLHKAETIWNGRASLAVGPVPSAAGPTPAALWMPAGDKPVPAVVLLGHGGSNHKCGPNNTSLAEILVSRFGWAAAAIDGPVHGDRRSDGPQVGLPQREEFLDYWRQKSDDGAVLMTAGWRGLVDALQSVPRLETARIGYAGVSMGTAYGLPFVAAEPRVSAAIFGMWAADYPASGHLVTAAKAVRCPTLFLQRWDDELFSREGTLALFDAISTADKRHFILPGPHGDILEEARLAALAFFELRLGGR